MSADGDDGEGSRRGPVYSIVGWGVGAFCLSFAIVGFGSLFFSGGGITGAIRAVLATFFFLAAAALAIPKTRGYVVGPLSETSGIRIGGALVTGLIVVAFIGGMGMIAGMGADTGDESQAIAANTETPETPRDADDPAAGSSDGTEMEAGTATETDAAAETQTGTASPTKTARPTATASTAPTATVSTTTTTTATPTATATATATAKPTATATATPSPTPTVTATPEPASGSMAMDVIQYTDDGNDNEHPNNEWVQFENQGGQAVSLSGWTVTDDSDRWSYPFGSVTVGPGDTIRLYTGEGSDTDSEMYWGYKRAVWNDTGDVVHLTDDDGELAVRFQYSGNEGGRASPS